MKSRLARYIHALVWGLAAIASSLNSLSAAQLQMGQPQTGRSSKIIVTGQERAVVKSTPIEMRPNRPLHVYGNTVRRRYYQQSPVALPVRVMTPAASRTSIR